MMSARLIAKHNRTKPFKCVVDSGSGPCLFHANLLQPLGLRLKDGIEDSIGGIGKPLTLPVFYHDIQVLIGIDWVIGVRAGFCEELAVAGILGRVGFFDCFKATFDHSEHPPILEIQRIQHRVVQ